MDNKLKYAFSIQVYTAINTLSIGKVISTAHNEDADILTVDIGPMEIPQYPVFLVNKVERVVIYIREDKLPTVVCRDDFPVVPHLNVHENGQKDLCLYDLSYEELKYQINGFVFIERVRYWFERTARNELHQKKQLLEPYFPYVNDSIILNFVPNNSMAVTGAVGNSSGWACSSYCPSQKLSLRLHVISWVASSTRRSKE